MTTFKTFLRIVQKNIWIIIMYSVILVVVSSANSLGGNNQMNFAATKPTVAVYDHDNTELSKSLNDYIKSHAEVIDMQENSNDLSDALYYNNLDYVVYIDEGFSNKIYKGEDFEVTVKSVKNYDAYLAENLTSRYVKIAKNFAGTNEKEAVNKIEKILENEVEVSLNTKLDTTGLANAGTYYNFMNYSLLAGLVFAIAYATIGFRRTMIKKRISISATSYSKINFKLMLCNFALAFVLWLVYNAIGVIIVGPGVMFTLNGLLMIMNSAVFTIFAVTLAFLLTNIFDNNNALMAVINIVSLGSSFLCGVFVPMKWMPDFITTIAHALPSYYYVNNNEILVTLEKIDADHLWPIALNMLVICGFIVATVIVNNIVIRIKRKA